MTNSANSADLERLSRTRQSGSIAHLPDWRGIDAEDIETGVRELLDTAGAELRAIESDIDPTWSGLMEPRERIGHRLSAVVGPINHLLSVKYSDELQTAYDAVRSDIVEIGNRINQSRPIYEGMLALRDSAKGAELSTARRRILHEAIRSMERSGVHLEGEARARYQEIDKRLSELSNGFGTNLVKEEKDSRVTVTNADRLDGVPAPLIAMARQQAVDDGVDGSDEDGPWHFVVSGVSYVAIIQHAKDRTLREESARLVGFDTYADLSIDTKMASSTEAVWELLDQLESAARPVAEAELESLKRFMAAASAPDAEALRDYFQLPRVLDGLFDLVTRLYDVEISESDDDTIPVWDDAVQFFEVRRYGAVIAGFYMDPYARPGEKRGGAWMNTVVDRDRLLAVGDAPTSLPVAMFVMNARPPTDGRPGLMSLDEVRTLFHEFGYATQHMFTDIDEGGASGMSLVEWDSVELASQFNEYWMEHKPFLKALTAHVGNGEPLDDDTIDRIIDSRNFMIGTATLRQLFFGKTDMRLHESFGITDDGPEPHQIEADMMAETLVVPMLAGESQLPAFGHLFAGGYAAGYYSYKWAEVLAADAFGAFREVGLDNDEQLQEVAARFRSTVLGLGGSLPAAEVYRLFRGRDATPYALLADQGLLGSGAA
jgi:oligopeptidase A